MKFTLGEITRICQGELIGKSAVSIVVNSIFTDSRNLAMGAEALFVAISGSNHDGHAYINELYSRGVRAFIVERDITTDKYADAGFVRVNSSVSALQMLAAYYRSKFKGTVVAVTGSNGKTVVKEWVSELIPDRVKLFRSPKSYNSQIGVPLSILMMEGDEDVAVIEAGISKPGEMERLRNAIRPDIGVFTTLGDAHQENFVSLDEKLGEKIKLFEGVDSLVFNSTGNPMVEVALRMNFPDAKLCDSSLMKEAYDLFSDRASKENAATALAVCDVLGFDHQDSVRKLKDLQPVAMRLELKEGICDSLIINDSYNSDINSLAIALDYLAAVAAGREQILILSDILQSSQSENHLYRRVADMVGHSKVGKVIGIGSALPRYADMFECETEFYPSTESYLASWKQSDIAGRAVLIKGNRNAHFEMITHALERKSHTTVLEINMDAMVHNLNVHRAKLEPQTKIMAMIKANGYGHGAYEIANALKYQGVDYLAVAFADEGVVLREQGISMPIVVLNADSDSFDLMIANLLEPEIYSMNSLQDFLGYVRSNCERDYPIHIKLDTGMHRLGFEEKDIPLLLEVLSTNEKFVRVKSIFSHLSSSDDMAQDQFTRLQFEKFKSMSEQLMRGLPYRPLRHIANSAAIDRFPESQFDMVRLGIGLYGFGAKELLPVATLKTRIVQIKEHDQSQTVGYGRAGKLSRQSRIATIPVGYADGLDRHLGNGRWFVQIGSHKAPIIGRVCMDTCMIDISDVNASEGDDVVIFGGNPDNSVKKMAEVLDTIPYEILTSISSRVKRIFVKE